ncbi:MAG: phage portal protein [Planctomycetota bacterium]
MRMPRYQPAHRRSTPDRAKGMSLNELQHHFASLRGGGEGAGVDRSYATVAAVYACVRWRAENLAGLPLMLVTDGDEVVESGPAVELTACPNPDMTARAFWLATSSMLDLQGLVCWVFTLDALGRPVEVRPVPRQLMRPELDRSTGKISYWTERDPITGGERRLTTDEVYLIRDPDFDSPADPLSALSPRAAVRHAIAQLHLSDLANESSIRSGASAGMVFSVPGNVTEEQKRSWKTQLNEYFSGPVNRKGWIVVEGGATAEPLGSSFRDMEFGEMRKFSRDDVCVAFGIGPATIGYFSDSNYSHAEASDRATWVNTMLPYAARLAEEWSRGVLSRWRGDRSLAAAQARKTDVPHARGLGFTNARQRALAGGMNLFAYFDSSGVPAVQRAQLELAQSAETWVRNGVPMADVIRATDAPFPSDEESRPWMHTWWVDLARRDVQEDTLSAFNDPPGPPTGATDPDDLTDPGEGGQSLRLSAADAEILRTTEAQRTALWASWRASWAGLERRMRGGVARHFNELRRATLARLDDAVPADFNTAPGTPGTPGSSPDDASKAARPAIDADTKRNLIASILFDIAEAKHGLAVIVGPLIRESSRLGGEQSMAEAADAKGTTPSAFNIDDPQLVEAMRQRLPRVTGIDDTLRKRIARTLAEGIDAGETRDDLAERLRREFNFASKRARSIAQTEVGAAVEEGRAVGREQAGVPLKSWLWSRRETGRTSHQRAEIETLAHPIPQGASFELPGDEKLGPATCPHPRATGDPGHDINCGCTTLSRFEGDSIKSLLDRYRSRGFLTYEALIARDAKPMKDAA